MGNARSKNVGWYVPVISIREDFAVGGVLFSLFPRSIFVCVKKSYLSYFGDS